jgi:hypothetical protein
MSEGIITSWGHTLMKKRLLVPWTRKYWRRPPPFIARCANVWVPPQGGTQVRNIARAEFPGGWVSQPPSPVEKAQVGALWWWWWGEGCDVTHSEHSSTCLTRVVQGTRGRGG